MLFRSNDPDAMVRFSAKKLFPNEETYYERLQKVHNKYGDSDIQSKFYDLYTLYFQISQEKMERRKIYPSEANSILEDLLA